MVTDEALRVIRSQRAKVLAEIKAGRTGNNELRQYWALRKAEQAIVDVLAMPLHTIELEELREVRG